MSLNNSIGQQAEQLASDYLQRSGLKVVTRNYLQRGGEIDIIMRDDTILVFVEVRYRQSRQFGGALDSITFQKQRKIIQTAQLFLQQYREAYTACRFDVVAIEPQNNDFNINWVKDAFQLN